MALPKVSAAFERIDRSSTILDRRWDNKRGSVGRKIDIYLGRRVLVKLIRPFYLLCIVSFISVNR